MNFWVDILACVAVAMGALTLVFLTGRYTPAKRVGVRMTTSIGGWCVVMLIITGLVVMNSGGH